MAIPRTLILSGYGLNCEDETAFAFEKAGAHADVVHLEDLITAPKRLDRYQILAVPGGFSFGDHGGSGRAYASKKRQHLSGAIKRFVARDTLTIGICNGFQILTEYGLLPGSLLFNEKPRYSNRWVDLAVEETESPWLRSTAHFSAPIAHGEGKYVVPKNVLSELKEKKQIALRYTDGELCKHLSLPANPNGSLNGIASVTSENGRVLGMMPHPERAIFFTQLPHWTYLREVYEREGKPLPSVGPGFQIFKNAVKYFV